MRQYRAHDERHGNYRRAYQSVSLADNQPGGETRAEDLSDGHRNPRQPDDFPADEENQQRDQIGGRVVGFCFNRRILQGITAQGKSAPA